MSYGLNIREAAALDCVSLGALVHRLDPGVIPFRKAHTFELHVSGGEFNVAANLADCFRLRTGVATAMVDYPVGNLIAERVRGMGVKPFYKNFEHNGVTGPNMAAVYSDRGQGVRGPVVFYNRSNEAAALLKPGDFNWDEVFHGRCPLVPFGRHFRGSIGHDFGSDSGRHAGGQEAGRDRVVRFELSREVVEHLWRRG